MIITSSAMGKLLQHNDFLSTVYVRCPPFERMGQDTSPRAPSRVIEHTRLLA